MTDKEFVLSRFPDAVAIMLNKGMYYIRDGGYGKMDHGDSLSGQFRKEADAWKDAADLIRQSDAGDR